MSDERQVYTLDAKMDTFERFDPFKDADPFSKAWDDTKTLVGMSPQFKRKTARAEKAYVIPRSSDGTISPQYATQAGTYANGSGAHSKQMNPGDVIRNAYGFFDVITPPYNLYELASLYDTSFANHAAIDATVENVVGLGYAFKVTPSTLRMLDGKADSAVEKAKARIERTKAEIEEWLDSCNDEDSFTNTLEKVYTDYKATGNGYIEIGRTTSGNIAYVGHIPSTTMRVRRLRDGFIQIISNRVVYFRNFGAKNPNPVTEDPRPNEVIHIKDYSPVTTFYGVPDSMSAISDIIGDALAAQYNIDYFENKAVPRYIIVVKGAKLSADSEEKLFRFLQTNVKGQNHRTLYIPLPVDQDGNKIEFEMKAVENTVQEGSFDSYRKSNRDAVFMAHQLPLSKVGSGDTGSLAAALSNDRGYKEQVSRPAQKNLERIIAKVIKEKTDIVEFKFNELTLTDENAQSQIHERYIQTQVLVPNEVRESIGYPARKGGDEPFEMSPAKAAETKNNVAGTDAQGKDRKNNASDSTATTSGRNPKGTGRASS